MSNVKKLMMSAAGGGDTLDVTDVFGMTNYHGNNGYKLVKPRIPPDASEGTHNTTDPKYYWWSATFSPEGDKCFICGRAGNSELHEYTLTRPFDLGSGYKTATFDFSSQLSGSECVKFNTDGTIMFIGSYVGDAIYQYTLSTGFDVSTASYANKSLDLTVANSNTNMRAMDFKSDGTKMFVFEASNQYVRGYNLSTAWDISTASSSGVSGGMETPMGGVVSPDGTKFFINGNNRIYEYTMSTAFNETTMSTTPTNNYQIYHTPTAANGFTWLTGDLGLTQVGNRLFYAFAESGYNKLGQLYLTDENDLSTLCNHFVPTDVDMSEDGGLLWLKMVSSSNSHCLYDSERGFTKELRTDTTGIEGTESNAIKAVDRGGFAMNSHSPITTTGKYRAWSFRKTPKFFDIVTYTGTGTTNTISHNLGCEVGSMIIKCRDGAEDWYVYHRSMGVGKYLKLNSPNAPVTDSTNVSSVTSSSFTLINAGARVNENNKQYVAYLFAHNNGDGEFGPNGDQDIIKCGSYIGNGQSGFHDGPDVNLGFEPEWLLIKNITDGTEWVMTDQKHGWMSAYQLFYVTPRASAGQSGTTSLRINLKPTGFTFNTGSGTLNNSGHEYVYWAIRKGPLKQPLHGMQVYAPHWYGQGYRKTYAPWKGDVSLISYKNTNSSQGEYRSKLLKSRLLTNINSGEAVDGTNAWLDFDDGYSDSGAVSDNFMSYMFRQAPGFLDEILYEGDGQSSQAIDHNLGSVPKMIWVKDKDGAEDWRVYISERAGTGYSMRLDTSAGEAALADFPSNPTATQFTVGSNSRVNANGNEYYAALWGEIDGVTKFGTYTGDGDVTTTHTINAGLNSPPRWVMIKEVDGSGSWWVFDSVIGLDGAGDARAWRLDLTNGWLTSQSISGAVTATSNGFTVSGTSYDELNENGKKYFYWAIT